MILLKATMPHEHGGFCILKEKSNEGGQNPFREGTASYALVINVCHAGFQRGILIRRLLFYAGFFCEKLEYSD